MLNSPSIWVWQLIVPHMIVIPLPSTPTSPSADSTTWTLTPHHEISRYTSHSNRHSLIQSLLTAISPGSQTNLSPISLVSVLPVRACLYPMLCRVPSGVMVCPPHGNYL